jgi:excisionase family DNA binding protein
MNSILKPVQLTIPSDLVSVKQAGSVAGITERTIWKKIRRGELNAWGPRRCYRISISELLAGSLRRP